jgi:hypothetical protein
MRKQVGVRVWEHRPALILTCSKDSLWTMFNEKYPNRLPAKQYFGVLDKEVWNLKKAYRETCLCRTCFNNRLFREGLAVMAKLIEILLLPSASQDAEVADTEGATGGQQGEPSSAVVEHLQALQQLHSFCASCVTGKGRANEKLVCTHKFHEDRLKCLSGKCESCGFKALWLPVRKTLVFDDAAGKLSPGVSEVWTTDMIWDSVQTGGDGSKSEDDLRQQHSGTVIAFLDKAMQAYSNFVAHSFHMQPTKTADRECYENTVPGMIRDNTDWSENGECKVKHQMHSEYLEPHDHSCQGNVGVVHGSFFTVVDQDSLEVGSDVMCSVRTTDGEVSLVKREYLRHRKWYRIASFKLPMTKSMTGQGDASLLQLRSTLLPHATSKDGRS